MCARVGKECVWGRGEEGQGGLHFVVDGQPGSGVCSMKGQLGTSQAAL